MGIVTVNAAETGLEVLDLEDDPAFANRRVHVHDAAKQVDAMSRLAQAFVENPDTMLQVLAEAAIDLCDADSAGISIEQDKAEENGAYKWVATAGEYRRFLNALLPRYPSACGVCLERGRPQLFRVTPRFFELIGIEAEPVTDGILLPWRVHEMRGTIWVMAHGRTEAFDPNDCHMMEMLANFAAMGVRQQRQQRLLMEQASVAAAASMANELAHKINNPLQSLSNIAYLSAQGATGLPGKALAADLSEQIQRLSSLVGELLALPTGAR